ncbi:MAG: uroporphyrinogen decarboxylase family protein [Anaerofustis sp.]
MENTYQDKVNRILTTVNHKEPDRVPILSMIGTFAISYANSSIQEIEEHPEKEIEVYCKPHEAIYSDATFTCGIISDPKSARLIGSKGHFISEDGQTIQHSEITPMEADEYPELIADPFGYTFNKMLPRKAKKLDEAYPESYNAVRDLIEHMKIKGAVEAQLEETLKEKYQLPVLSKNVVYPPMDIIFDYYRGFKGISLDLRRQPDQLLGGINALEEMANMLMGIAPNAASVPEFPFYPTMMHLPTFISPKQFEKFFWPTYERLFQRLHSLGGKLIMFLEGTWAPKYEFLNSMPENFAVGILEEDDVFEAKKKIGDRLTIAGGMPSDMLKYASEQECIDHAKKVVDACAPGGGFIFSTNRELISKGDVNLNNLIAVNRYVHENAVY